jgi:hypothetical protein
MSDNKVEIELSSDVVVENKDQEPSEPTRHPLVELMLPTKDKYGEVVPFWTRLHSFLFPGFYWLSFTFFLGVVWIVWNVFVQIMIISDRHGEASI